MQQQSVKNDAGAGNGGDQASLHFLIESFLIDTNLGLKVEEEPIASTIKTHRINPVFSTDLEHIDRELRAHKPDIAQIPIGDFHRLVGKGDKHYQGLVQATSKRTGQVRMRSLLVVRQDDPATSFDDLQGAKYGIINRSCSSTYFPPCILLAKQGKKIDDYFEVKPVKQGSTWQGLVDAVVSGEVRATMVLDDVWKSEPENEKTTKVIGEYAGGLPGVVIVRADLDTTVRTALRDALLGWVPAWNAVYGPFRPFSNADVHSFFHDLDSLPEGD